MGRAISRALREAREYEENAERMTSGEERPDFHLSARTGWMNDPNGFSYYGGKYHLFYQYHPYDTHWGPMHWGHAVSRDLLHWEHLPAALAPDEAYDRDGCFSGSAAVLPDGRHLLMYTGVAKEPLADGGFRELQTQCLAVGDGTDYEKYEANPVLCGRDLPDGASESDFRDPKIWQREDGSYCCVAANRSADGSGQVLLFASPDGFGWRCQSVLAANRDRFGKMWECPDFFRLDGKWILLVSFQDMLPVGLEYHNGNGTLCLIGDFDGEAGVFTEQSDQAVDYGIDFYAPQTLLAPDGRRIMIGWMQHWETCDLMRRGGESWFGQMSLPRELSVRNGRLYQRPVRELEEMRRDRVAHEDVTFSGVVCLDGIRGRRVDLELCVRPVAGQDIYRKFAVRFAQNDRYHTAFSFRPGESVLKLDRKFSGSRRAAIHQRRCMAEGEAGELKLRIILDRFSVEAFVNDGERVMSAVIYTDQEAEGITFFADGYANMDVVKYDLV